MRAIRYAREKKVPFFGICLGLQTAVIEYARNVAGLEDANSTEFEEDPKHKVIFKLRDLIGVEALGGTMRLGKYPCELLRRLLRRARPTARALIWERHRHRYEVNQEFLPKLKEAGLSFTGMSPDKKFVEIIELHEDHPWFLGCQFHPELKSKPFACHPLFKDFIRAARAHRAAVQDEAAAESMSPVPVARAGETRPDAGPEGRDRPRTSRPGAASPSSSPAPASSSRASTPSPMAERLKAIGRRDRGANRLQVLLRQGQPVLEGLLPRPRPRGGPRHPRGREGEDGAARDLRRPRAGAGGEGGPRPRRAADPGLPRPADRPRDGRRGDRQARQRQEGPVHGARGHEPRRREVPRRRQREDPALRARGVLRLPQPRRRHAVVPDHAGDGLSRHLRRDPLPPASRRREGDRGASSSTRRSSRAPRRPPAASTAFSSKSTTIPTARSRTGRRSST